MANTNAAGINELGDGGPSGSSIGDATTDKVGFHGSTPVVQASAPTTVETTLTNAGTASDWAIQALTNSTPYGFVTQAEGESLVEVVLNNQARLTEVIVALQAKGLIA
jgi:hypothetical protein